MITAMDHFPRLEPAIGYLPSRSRQQPRSTSDSPTRQRKTDELLSQLTPRTAVDAFRNPSGALKKCMDAATHSEQAFAMRAAVASRSIQEWVEELQAWPWPTHDTWAGLERPPAKRRKLFSTSKSDEESRGEYMGSLLAADVARYETRVEEIRQDLEATDVKEIQRHVLHNHIMPLSRPGTPLSDSLRPGTLSASAYVHMDDFTAIITATVVQALPNLSRLGDLLDTWAVRLFVLRKSSVYLPALEDAEIALQAGWKAMEIRSNRRAEDAVEGDASTPRRSVLSRSDFETMKLVVEGKVARAGQHLDSMLDALEGRQDTLPEDWVDRMDTVEHEYAEWLVACERKIREEDWARMVREMEPSVEMASRASRSSSPPIIKVHPAEEDVTGTGEPSHEQPPTGMGRFDGLKETTGTLDDAGDELVLDETEMYPDDQDLGSDIEFPLDDEVPEPDLPPMPRERRESELSSTSTVLHGVHSDFASFSSDLPDQGTPDRHRLRDFPLPPTEAGEDMLPSVENDGIDLPSSPPDFRSSTRSFSVSFNEFPTVHEVPEEDTSPRTPMDLSFGDEMTWDDANESLEVGEVDGSMHHNSPAPRKVSIAAKSDQQLQQQISEILESIPARIKLTTEPAAVNLNPPDFTMPTRATRPRHDLFPRSQSSMSTRSSRPGTPSFTLAPADAKNRTRHQANQQEIKVYHLSRLNNDAPVKLFIRCVGENGERVMVRVGGGWADLGEYLKEYASHHGRRSGDGKVEIRDLPRITTANPVGSSPQSRAGSMPPTRPASAMEMSPSPITPLHIRKSRRSMAAEEMTRAMNRQPLPKTPLANTPMVLPASSSVDGNTPSSGERSRSSSRLSWAGGDLEADTSLGMAGPKGKTVEMTAESKAWVESVKEKVRIASGERPKPPMAGADSKLPLGDMGKVGATKRLFRRGQTPDLRTPASGNRN